MNLKTQRRVAAGILKVGKKRVYLDPNRASDIKEAITRADIKGLIKEKAIWKKQKKGISTFRSKKVKLQKRKGRRKGPGSRKGKRTARLPRKKEWIIKIRTLRNLIRSFRDKKIIDGQTYRLIIKKSKGGFFRSKRHLKLYLKENNLFLKKPIKEKELKKQKESKKNEKKTKS